MNYKSVLEEQIRELQKVQDVLVEEVVKENQNSNIVDSLSINITKIATTMRDLIVSASMFGDK